MKPRILSLAPVATIPLAILLALGACRNTPSHWDPDQAAESASFQMLGANGATPDTITQTTRQGSQEVTLAMRRYFFNDNPANPLQQHRANTFGRYVPIWDMPVNALLDTGEIVGYSAVRAGEGLWGAFLMPFQLLLGTNEVEHYQQPPPPSQFEVEQR